MGSAPLHDGGCFRISDQLRGHKHSQIYPATEGIAAFSKLEVQRESKSKSGLTIANEPLGATSLVNDGRVQQLESETSDYSSEEEHRRRKSKCQCEEAQSSKVFFVIIVWDVLSIVRLVPALVAYYRETSCSLKVHFITRLITFFLSLGAFAFISVQAFRYVHDLNSNPKLTNAL